MAVIVSSLQKSKNPRAQQIWEVLKKQNPNDSVVTQEKAAEKVAHGKFGFIGGVESVDKMAAASNGTLFRIPGPIETGVSLAPFAVKKGTYPPSLWINPCLQILFLQIQRR